jgi:extradiol dioxygenase family protein
MAPIDDALATIAGEAKPYYAQVAREFKVDRNTLARRHKGIIISQEDYYQNSRFLSRKQTKFLINYIKNLTS